MPLKLHVIAPTLFPGISLRAINSGPCAQWAYAAWLLEPRLTLCTEDNAGHAFVRCPQRLFYDAERSAGIHDFRDLPVFARSVQPRLNLELEEMTPRAWVAMWLGPQLASQVEDRVTAAFGCPPSLDRTSRRPRRR